MAVLYRDSSKWDIKPEKEYFQQLFRVSKNQVICGANYFIEHLTSSRGIVCWDKRQTMPTLSSFEFIWTSFDKVAKTYYGVSTDLNRFHPTQKPVKLYKWLLENFGTCRHCKNQGGFYEDIVGDGGSKMWVECEECDIAENGAVKILDTHMGSQSSRIAAYDMGFDYYGCELDKDYFEAGNKRFELFKSQGKLF